MSDDKAHVMPAHGACELPAVVVESYNAELRDSDGFIGDRASSRAFGAILDDWRERLRKVADDPLGDRPTEKVRRRTLDKMLIEGDVDAAGLVLTAVEEFAQELAAVCRRLLRLKGWREVEAIVVGGGFRASRIGELAIGRAGVLLKADGREIALHPIRHDPDEAGLLGSTQLIPHWMLSGHDAILAVDIGGTNFRAGVVSMEWRKHALTSAEVVETESWRHRDEQPSREEAVAKLVRMLRRQIKAAEKKKLKLAPFIGIGCPGIITAEGSIERGGQNLPGNWESARFHLPGLIQADIPDIAGQPTHVLMHNDAVVQGLSETPWMMDVAHWGVLTIGTGLGNACFTTRD